MPNVPQRIESSKSVHVFKLVFGKNFLELGSKLSCNYVIQVAYLAKTNWIPDHFINIWLGSVCRKADKAEFLAVPGTHDTIK